MDGYGWSGVAVTMVLSAAVARAEQPPAAALRDERGTVHFRPLGDQANIPRRYRLEEHTFDYEMVLKRDLPVAGIEIYNLHFPSPVVSACPENNTVYAEYYRPKSKGPFPSVIVL